MEIAAQFADVYVRALHASHELILEPIETEGIECDYVRRGQVHVGEEADATDVEAALSLAGKLGHDDYRRLDPPEVKRMSGVESQLDGAVSVGAGTWHPAKWVWGILQAAIASGKVRLFSRTAARAVERDGDGYIVRTDRGDIRTPNVVNATDSHTQRLFDSWLDIYPNRRLVWPYRVQGIYAEPAPADIPTGVGVITGLGFFAKIPKGGTVFGTDHSPVKPHEAGRIDPSRFVTKFMCAEISRLWGSIPMQSHARVDGLGGRRAGLVSGGGAYGRRPALHPERILRIRFRHLFQRRTARRLPDAGQGMRSRIPSAGVFLADAVHRPAQVRTAARFGVKVDRGQCPARLSQPYPGSW